MGSLLNKVMNIAAERRFAYYPRIDVSSDEAVNVAYLKIILLQR